MICKPCADAADLEARAKAVNKQVSSLIVHCDDKTGTRCFCQHKESGSWNGTAESTSTK